MYRVSVLPNISVNIGDWYQVNIGWRLKFDKYHQYTICHGLLTVAATNKHLPPTHKKDHSINFTLEASVGRSFKFFGAPPLWVLNYKSEDMVTCLVLGYAWEKICRHIIEKSPNWLSLPHFMTLACHDAQAIYDSISHELGTFTQSRRNSANPTPYTRHSVWWLSPWLPRPGHTWHVTRDSEGCVTPGHNTAIW